jgi:hypothetical protein
MARGSLVPFHISVWGRCMNSIFAQYIYLTLIAFMLEGLSSFIEGDIHHTKYILSVYHPRVRISKYQNWHSRL